VLATTGSVVAATAPGTPVLVGATGGVAAARERVRAAASQGADGVLLFPPGAAGAGDDGLVDYVVQVAAASSVPVVVYQRAGMVLSVDAAVRLAQIPAVVGLKDGSGLVELVQAQVRTVRRVRPDFLFFNGLPTAEVTMPAYRAIGVERYSSAVFAFAPQLALAFHRALLDDDDATQEQLLADFFVPFATLRGRRADYPVALVKAGVEAGGLAVGPPRAPAARPAPADLAALTDLLARAGAAPA
jgi:5-dehydro-4-deoxyglucarate dehydratase